MYLTQNQSKTQQNLTKTHTNLKKNPKMGKAASNHLAAIAPNNSYFPTLFWTQIKNPGVLGLDIQQGGLAPLLEAIGHPQQTVTKTQAK